MGNTLLSIDFAWVSEELRARGVDAAPEALRRAEAAARPRVSRRLHEAGESPELFAFQLLCVLEGLEAARGRDEAQRRALVRELVPVLRARPTPRLWSQVLPGVPEALERLRASGLAVVAVSNSDGTVEQGLADCGLRGHFDAVVDSHVVGFAKPDPRIFHHALVAVGREADPARTLHVGDLYHADVSGARAAGLHALLLDPYGDWEDVDCPRARDLSEIAGRVEGS